MSEDKEYLIDIASESQYQNQNEEYHKAYTEWRMNEHNRFGYKFSKDTREHTYAYGEGFEYNEASDAERKTLRDVSSLIGSVLLISALIRLLQAIFDSRAGHILSGAAIELSGSVRPSERAAVIALSLFRPVALFVCIVIMQSFIRLPKKVFLPRGSKVRGSNIACMIGTIGGAAIVCYVISVFFSRVFDTKYFAVTGGFVWTEDMKLNAHYFINQYIVCALLHAILINGIFLQTLRQFNDAAAIFFSTLIEGFMAISFTKISTHLVMSVLFCILTIKSGTIIAPIIARVLVNCIFFSLRLVAFYYPESSGELYILLYCVVVLGLGMFSIGRLLSADDFDFEVINVKTQLKFPEKIRIFFTTMPMIEWYAAAVVAWLFILVA